MIIFGGYDADGFKCNDMYEFDLSGKTEAWTKVTPALVQPPTERMHHSAVVWRAPNTPSSSSSTTTMFVFGGSTTSTTTPLSSDLYSYEFETSGQQAPPARYGHVSFIVDDKLFIQGGTDGMKDMLDAYYLDIPSKTWHRVSDDSLLPLTQTHQHGGCQFHSCALYKNVCYLFGGQSRQSLDALRSVFSNVSIGSSTTERPL